MNNRFSLVSFFLAAIFLLSVVLAFPRYTRTATEATLSWDVSGYYLYLPAVFIYDDLEELKFLPDIIQKYTPSYAPDQAYDYGNGKRVMKYPAGMAVLYSPFFFAAHMAAKVLDYPADGFSRPYQVAIQIGGVLVAILGLWFMRKNLLHYFSDRVTGFSLLLIGLGTNFLNYGTFDAALPHVWLFTLLAMLVHFTVRWHTRPTWTDSLMIGVCIGLAALARPTEVIYAMIPLLWGIADRDSFLKKWQLLKSNLPSLLLTVSTVAAIGFIQLAYWHSTAGEWIHYSYQDQGFSFFSPHFPNVLFSYRKGWFIYTPLMIFAVWGLYFLFRYQRKLFLPVFSFALINTWIVCSWDIWWYGGSFGQRAMVQSYALLAFPLAAFISWAGSRTWTKWTFGLLLSAILLLNVFQTYQAHWGPWEADAMNKAYYWRIFAKTFDNPYDKFLLDTREAFNGERRNQQRVYFTDFENVADSTGLSREVAKSGDYSLHLPPGEGSSAGVVIPRSGQMTSGRWLSIYAWFYSPGRELEPWWMPQLVVQFVEGDKVIRERFVRPFRVMQPDEWRQVAIDLSIPDKDFDSVNIFLRNPRDRVALYMDDLYVDIFDE